jgi:hypothetical protein
MSTKHIKIINNSMPTEQGEKLSQRLRPKNDQKKCDVTLLFADITMQKGE